jgi:hypothetical protein
LLQNQTYKDIRVAKIGQGKKKSSIIRCRPIFDNWKSTFEIGYDPELIEGESIKKALEVAGREIGICDYRPKYGRFEIINLERVKGE